MSGVEHEAGHAPSDLKPPQEQNGAVPKCLVSSYLEDRKLRREKGSEVIEEGTFAKLIGINIAVQGILYEGLVSGVVYVNGTSLNGNPLKTQAGERNTFILTKMVDLGEQRKTAVIVRADGAETPRNAAKVIVMLVGTPEHLELEQQGRGWIVETRDGKREELRDVRDAQFYAQVVDRFDVSKEII